MSVRIIAEGLPAIERYLLALPELASKAAALAINQVASRQAPKLLREGIEAEVAFPDGYVEPRITLTRKAYHRSLEAVISARHRPTSLARFARGARPGGARGAGVNVQVGRGRTQVMKRAFLIRLKAGKQLTDETFNTGLAIRLKKGEKIDHKRKMTSFGGGLYLLYGPSVNQVMADVAGDKSPEILGAIEDEFLRQFVRLGEKA